MLDQEVVRSRLADIVRWPSLMFHASVTLLLLFVLNWTTVKGRENIPRGCNVGIGCNHRTMIDSFVVSVAFLLMRPLDIFRPWLIPWHFAARENYAKNWPMRIWAWNVKIYPVKAGRRDVSALHAMCNLARLSRIFVFPGGTRERPGKPVRPQLGIGHVAYENRATIIPVYIEGMEKVLPIGTKKMRFGKKIRIVIGPPVPYEDLLTGDPKSAKLAIAQRVVEHIYALANNDAVIPRIETSKPS